MSKHVNPPPAHKNMRILDLAIGLKVLRKTSSCWHNFSFILIDRLLIFLDVGKSDLAKELSRGKKRAEFHT